MFTLFVLHSKKQRYFFPLFLLFLETTKFPTISISIYFFSFFLFSVLFVCLFVFCFCFFFLSFFFLFLFLFLGGGGAVSLFPTLSIFLGIRSHFLRLLFRQFMTTGLVKASSFRKKYAVTFASSIRSCIAIESINGVKFMYANYLRNTHSYSHFTHQYVTHVPSYYCP